MQTQTQFNSLPYHEVFREFVQNKYPLGVDDYLSFLRLLSTSLMYKPENYRMATEDLLEICKILWLKPDTSVIEFENVFWKGFSQLPVLEIPTDMAAPDAGSENQQDQNPLPNADIKENEQTDAPLPDVKLPEPIQPTPAAGQSIEENTAKFFSIRFGDSGSVGGGMANEVVTASRKFLFTDNYFPVSKRGIHQLFSTLPVKKARNAAKVADIEGTIGEIAKSGFLSGVVFKKEEEIFNELVILNDFGGSMIAFEQLTDLFSEIMSGLFNGNHQKPMAANYYFQNVIDEYLYLNKSSTKFEKLNAFVDKYSNSRVAIIIISDAGAARRSNTNARFYGVVRMLTSLEKITRHIVWLNPVPREFWKNNLAQKISNFVPMFDISDADLKLANSILRGRQIKNTYQ